MTDRDIELRLKKAVEACTPDVLEKVMAGCDNQIENIVPFERKRTPIRKYMAAIAACIAIVVGVLGYANFNAGRIVSIVSLEINPSIELKINKDSEVVEANPLNTDAEQIMEGMRLKGVDVYTATNALVGSLLKHGYIDELANSILLSVEDEDAERGNALQESLMNEIDAILDAAAVNASILSQYVDGEAVESVSQEFEISHGKAALIERILKANDHYSLEELAKLSVNELNLIQSNSKNQVEEVESTGPATDGSYIGTKRANEIAFEHAGLSESTVEELEVEMDYEYHAMVYEVKFVSKGVEYEYYIHAETGEVLGVEREADD